MNTNEKDKPLGSFRTTIFAQDGTPLEDVDLEFPLEKIPGELSNGRKHFQKSNLVVNSGRGKIAKLLGSHSDTKINRVILGDGPKDGNLPDLQDSSLVSELSDSNNNKKGTFSIDPDNEVFYPARTGRFPTGNAEWGSADGKVTVDSDDHSYLKDTTVNFFNIGVQRTDQVTLDTQSGDFTLQVRQIVDEHTIELNNPNQYTTPKNTTVQYRIDTPGTQVLFSKLVRGNDFPESDWGIATLVREGGLLFNDGTLFNRVVFGGKDDDKALLLQPDTASSKEVSIRFEVIITL